MSLLASQRHLWPHLARAGIIDASFAEAAHAALCKYWPYPKGTLPIDRPVTRGSFLPKV